MVSVIIPIYKVEKYLDRCVESVVNQTYKDLEIILVDDGSPDNCATMCEEWAKKDERIKVIHKLNGGLSSARNAGLDICTGDYIMFLDSDDWYDLETVEQCILEIIGHKSDIAVFGIRGVTDTEVKEDYFTVDKFDYDKMITTFCLTGDCVMNKMYRKQIWQNLRFEQGLIFEDAFVLADVYGMTTNMCFIPRNFYNYYRSNSGSIMHKIYDNPKEPWYRWKYESHIVDRLGVKLDHKLLDKMKIRAMEHALKAYIVNLSLNFMSDHEFALVKNYIDERINECSSLKLEYKLYLCSYQNFNILNRIKSLEYMWRYRNWE